MYQHDPKEDIMIGDYFKNITSEGPLRICFDSDGKPNEFYAAWIDGWKEGVEEFCESN